MLQSSQNVPHLVVQGGFSLSGSVEVQGSKNAVLVSICALLLTQGISVLRNVPCITDVFEMIKIIEYLGAKVSFDRIKHILVVDTSLIKPAVLDTSMTGTTRASILLAGPLLATQKRCSIGLPGGDLLGSRPIDYHFYAFKRLGCTINMHQELFELSCENPQSNRIVFEYPSVGATENALMLAVLSEGITTIVNAALEPEVMELIYLLGSMGAIISCELYATLVIRGVKRLHPTDYTIIPDRLEVGTLLIAAAATQGSITISNAQPWHLELVLMHLENMGNTLDYQINKQGISLRGAASLQPVLIKTGPYPGFPTDLQALMAPLLTKAHGQSIISETVYQHRFQYTQGLESMGAKLVTDGPCLRIQGSTLLKAAHVRGSDIRATASLLMAGLIAEGTTIISGTEHLKRGYQSLEQTLISLGACLTWQD